MESASPNNSYADYADADYSQPYQPFSERYANRQLTAYHDRPDGSAATLSDATADGGSGQRQIAVRGESFTRTLYIFL